MGVDINSCLVVRDNVTGLYQPITVNYTIGTTASEHEMFVPRSFRNYGVFALLGSTGRSMEYDGIVNTPIRGCLNKNLVNVIDNDFFKYYYDEKAYEKGYYDHSYLTSGDFTNIINALKKNIKKLKKGIKNGTSIDSQLDQEIIEQTKSDLSMIKQIYNDITFVLEQISFWENHDHYDCEDWKLLIDFDN